MSHYLLLPRKDTNNNNISLDASEQESDSVDYYDSDIDEGNSSDSLDYEDPELMETADEANSKPDPIILKRRSVNLDKGIHLFNDPIPCFHLSNDRFSCQDSQGEKNRAKAFSPSSASR